MFKKNHPQGWFFSVQHHFYWSDNLQYPKSTKTRYFRRNNGFLWSMRPGSNRRPAAGLNEVSRQWRCPQVSPPGASYSCASCYPIKYRPHGAAGRRPSLEQNYRPGNYPSYGYGGGSPVQLFYPFAYIRPSLIASTPPKPRKTNYPLSRRNKMLRSWVHLPAQTGPAFLVPAPFLRPEHTEKRSQDRRPPET